MSAPEPADKRAVANERDARPRHQIRAAVAFSGPEIEGEGGIANISTSGALIEPATYRASPGTRLGLLILCCSPGSELWWSKALTAEVVRTTDWGFAVRFHR